MLLRLATQAVRHPPSLRVAWNHHKHKGKKVSLVIFDKDGTLYNTEKVWREWLRAMTDNIKATCTEGSEAKVMRALGVNPETGVIADSAPIAMATWGQLRQIVANELVNGITPDGLHKIHLSRKEGTTAAAKEAPTHSHTHSHAHHKSLVTPDAALGIVEGWGKSVDLARMHEPLFDVRHFFASIKAKNIKIAINTSDDRHVTEKALKHDRVDQFVSCIVAGDDGLKSKPSPDSILHICKTLSVPLQEAVMVGDTLADTRMREIPELGLVVGVLSGSGSRESLSKTADMVLPDASHLLQHL